MLDTPEAPLLGELAGASPTERLDGRRTARRSIGLPVIEVINFHSTTFYHTFPPATRLNGRKTAKTGRKVEKMRGNHSAAAPQSQKTLGGKTPESPKIPLQLGCSVTQIRHFFKRTFFNLPLIFENNVKKATVWLHERGPTGFAKPLPLGATTTTAASGGNREELLGPRPAGCERERSRRWEPQPGQCHRR